MVEQVTIDVIRHSWAQSEHWEYLLNARGIGGTKRIRLKCPGDRVVRTERQCVGRLMAERKLIVSLLEDEHPSRLKTPEPYAEAYRTGVLNFESIESKSV